MPVLRPETADGVGRNGQYQRLKRLMSEDDIIRFITSELCFTDESADNGLFGL